MEGGKKRIEKQVRERGEGNEIERERGWKSEEGREKMEGELDFDSRVITFTNVRVCIQAVLVSQNHPLTILRQ